MGNILFSFLYNLYYNFYMIDLKEVKDYIEETVSVIALATGMDTIIGDLREMFWETVLLS